MIFTAWPDIKFLSPASWIIDIYFPESKRISNSTPFSLVIALPISAPTFDPIKESLVEIRVAFQMYEITKELNTLFSNNETIESDLTDQPEIYQAFFEQIDKELFVRKNKY